MSPGKTRSRKSWRRTKIVCTIGPATRSKTALERLARAGMDVARLNFSYGAREDHEHVIASIRAIERKLGRPMAIIQDLAGFKLRVGDIAGGAIALRRRQEIVLSTARSPDPSAIPIRAADLPKALSAGERLLLADGKMELEVLDTTSTDIRCRVRAGGLLQSRQGLAAPDTALPMRAATKKDLADLRFGLEHSVDWVAMSFVRNAEDLRPLRRI
ncbi:MAG: pyruvate kinase, partial [Armatimonadota bacterium]